MNIFKKTMQLICRVLFIIFLIWLFCFKQNSGQRPHYAQDRWHDIVSGDKIRRDEVNREAARIIQNRTYGK